MKVYVFLGPSLPVAAARAELDAEYLPPVSQGDVYALCRKNPAAIGIIDGYFERRPAVWHKEILWALSLGVTCFGAASMGALRAVELHPFGMIGVGEIFQGFKNGALEDDDEVAVLHGPADSGYLPASEAMVNIRSTLVAAAAAGVISSSVRDRLIGLAKGQFYAERQYDTLLSLAAGLGLPAQEIRSLATWLPEGRIDQKRRDAVALLREIREWASTGAETASVGFTFQPTDAWAQLRREVDQRPAADGEAGGADHFDSPVNELKLKGQAYRSERAQALVRSLCLRLARMQSLDAGSRLLEEVALDFCHAQGLSRPEDIDLWLEKQEIDGGAFDRLMRSEALVRRMRALVEADLEPSLVDHLRFSGRYGALLARAEEKRRVLESHGIAVARLADLGITEDGLWHWYFAERLGMTVPDDLQAYARGLDFEAVGALQVAVLRELYFVRLRKQGPAVLRGDEDT